MNVYEFWSLPLLFVSGFHLVPAVIWGVIPSRWPVYPLRRAEKPAEFWVTFGVFTAAGMVGLALLIAGLLIRAGF